MSETQHPENQENSEAASIESATWTSFKEKETARWMDSVEVVLEFSLGHHKLTLGELKRLGQGHIFAIKWPATGVVNILLQGQRIGCGELVKIGDSVGLFVSELVENKLPANFVQTDDHSNLYQGDIQQPVSNQL